MKYLIFIIFCVGLFYSSNCLNIKELVAVKNKYFVEFDVSMEKGSILYQKKYKNLANKVYLDKLYKLYEENNLKKIPVHENPLIEKNIHQIWVGGKSLPKVYVKLQESWKKMHPDWNYYLWTDNEVKNLKLINKKFYDQTKDPVEKANILRYELLYQFGGLYADIDMQSLKSFDILHHCYEFYTGIEHNFCPPILNNALIGCKKGSPIMYECIMTIKNDWHKSLRIERTGVIHFSKSFHKMLNSPILKIALPMSYFYPLVPGFYTINKINNLEEVIAKIKNSQSFAIHFYKSGASLGQILEAVKISLE